MRAAGCDLESNPRALYTPDLPSFGEHSGDESGKSSDLTTENPEKDSAWRSSARVNEDAGSSVGLFRPRITFPSRDPNKTQIVEVEMAEVPLPDVPRQHRFAEPAVWSLREGVPAGEAQVQLSNQSPVMRQAGISVMEWLCPAIAATLNRDHRVNDPEPPCDRARGQISY